LGIEENKAIARRFITEIISENHWDRVGEVLSDDLVVYHPSAPGGSLHGLEAAKSMFVAFRAGFPDLTLSIEDEVAEGDQVVIQWRGRGTQTGDLFGMAPTGRPVNVGAVSIFRIADGKIVEDHISEDTLGMMKQLGAIPE
jgi:predicted ester cyclase